MGEFAHNQESAAALRLVVDAANVVGSRPDGWWRDRAGAAARLRDRLAALAGAGLDADDLPEDVAIATAGRIDCEIVMVVEGRARPVAGDEPGEPRLRVVAASGEGDDQIVAQAVQLEPPVVVVTADRGLKARVQAVGAVVAGPRWLLALLDTFPPAQPVD